MEKRGDEERATTWKRLIQRNRGREAGRRRREIQRYIYIYIYVYLYKSRYVFIFTESKKRRITIQKKREIVKTGGHEKKTDRETGVGRGRERERDIYIYIYMHMLWSYYRGQVSLFEPIFIVVSSGFDIQQSSCVFLTQLSGNLVFFQKLCPKIVFISLIWVYLW